MIYRLYKTDFSLTFNAALTVDQQPGWSFLFVETEPRYQTFKAQINADEAQLEDADGVLMTSEEAKAFVATLP